MNRFGGWGISKWGWKHPLSIERQQNLNSLNNCYNEFQAVKMDV